MDGDSVQVPGKFSKRIEESPFSSTHKRPTYQMELQINLPVQTMIEQIELRFSPSAEKFDLWGKYLKISGVTRSSVLRREAHEKDAIAGQDIQMGTLSPEGQQGDVEGERRR